VFAGNAVYIFSNAGAFLTSGLYCLWLHARHKTLGEIAELPAGFERASLPVNWAMAVLTGFLWYGQFFFYNLGHVRMGAYRFTSWAIHMIMLILFSIVVGWVLREWRGARRATRIAVGAAFAVLLAAVLALAYGNRVAEAAAERGAGVDRGPGFGMECGHA
jgi:L-rhamnose-H+ transport protein